MPIPPGITYLAERVQYIAGPPALVYLADYILRTKDIHYSRWSVACTSILSLPALLTLAIIYTRVSNKVAARRLGARLPPVTRDGTPGNLRTLIRVIKEHKTMWIGQDFYDMLDQYGLTFNLRALFSDRILTIEPAYIKSVLATQFDEFEKGPETISVLSSLFGTGVFNSDGDLWKFHRTMARPFFSKERISDFDIFESHTDIAINLMKMRLRQGLPVDFQDLIGRFTVDAATHFLLGKEVGTLAVELPYPKSSDRYEPLEKSVHYANRFLYAFQETQEISAFRLRFGLHWPLFDFWKDKTLDHMEVIDDFIRPVLAEALANKKEEAAINKAEEDTVLLQHLVNCTDDRTIMRDQVLNLLVAARDTTAATLTFIVYMLAEHPDVLRQLREEVLTQVGPSDRPTYDDIRKMKLMRAVINETLRLYAPVPFNVRSNKDHVLWPSTVPGEKPLYIAPHTRILYSDLIMHRRTDLWGPDATNWDPDRFLDERLHKYLTPNPFIFLPFNAGPRICLGQQFAYNEMSFFLTRLLQNFSDIELALDAWAPEELPPPEWKAAGGLKAREKIRVKSHVTIYSEGGFWVKMKEATNL